jgi:uncharacterized protein (DUF2062 family)
MQKGLKRLARYWYLRLIRIQATPHNIALGLAVGVFAGLLPIVPFQIAVAVTLALIVRGNKIAAALGTWIINPFNFVPFYIMCYCIGKTVVPFAIQPFDFARLEVSNIFALGWDLFAAMMVGGLVVAVPGMIITYIVAYKGITLYRKRKTAQTSSRVCRR